MVKKKKIKTKEIIEDGKDEIIENESEKYEENKKNKSKSGDDDVSDIVSKHSDVDDEKQWSISDNEEDLNAFLKAEKKKNKMKRSKTKLIKSHSEDDEPIVSCAFQ